MYSAARSAGILIMLLLVVCSSARSQSHELATNHSPATIGRDVMVTMEYDPGDAVMGDTIPVGAGIINTGTFPVKDVEIIITHLDDSMVPLFTEHLIAAGTLMPGESRHIDGTPLVVPTPGRYHIRRCCVAAGDETPANDCRTIAIDVRGNADVQPLRPQAGVASPLAGVKFNVLDSIPITIMFQTWALRSGGSIPVMVSIWEGAYRTGQLVYNERDTIALDVKETYSKRQFRTFVPQHVGTYTIEAISNYAYDNYRLNDTIVWSIEAIPAGGSVRVATLDGISNDPTPDAHIAVGTAAPVDAVFINDGQLDADSATASMEITDQRGAVVYREHLTLPIMPKGGASLRQSFPGFLPRSIGWYCATAWIDYDYDVRKADDTAHWCFMAIGPSGVVDNEARSQSPSLTIYPNPAVDHATLDYSIPSNAHARVRLYDAVGREVALLAELHSNPTGHIAVGFDGLASGVYTIAIEGADGVIASRPITITR
jgi:hypothetical protein